MASLCECGNELSGSIKFAEFLNWLKPARFSRRTVLRGVREFMTVLCTCG